MAKSGRVWFRVVFLRRLDELMGARQTSKDEQGAKDAD